MPDNSLENRYYSYLREHDYSDVDALKKVLGVYVPYFAGHEHVLDIGCGHGEFLALLQAAGHHAVGVDVDQAMVQACVEQGHEVHLADALTWLPNHPAAFDGIFSSNVIEHLAAPQVLALFRACYTALRPGGLFLVGVPNPASIIVQLHEFWRDATHVRLYSAQLLEFFLDDAGFRDVTSAENDAARWDGLDTLLPQTPTPLTPELPGLEQRPVPPPLPRPMRRIQKADEYWEALRGELELQRTQSLALTKAVVDLQRRMENIERAYRYLSPSREIFVVGHKPTTEGEIS